MADSASQKLIDDFGLQDRSPREFLRSIHDLDTLDHPFPRSHSIRHAWRQMDLNGVLYAESQPIAYFKEVQRPLDDPELRDLHKRFWNHGLCPVLVVVSANNVEVYSSRALPAHPDQDPRSPDRLVQVLERTAETADALKSLTSRIETGRILETANSFRPERAIDEYLLRNLRDTRQCLLDAEGSLTPEVAHALLGRTIFASYLAQRRIINGPFFESIGASGITDVVELLGTNEPEVAHTLLYKLFKKLQGPFQSSLFAGDIEEERRHVGPQHMSVLAQFLQGHEVGSGQQTLFSTYDFSLIPVELISAIYEDFLRAEGESHQQQTGAYYTPPQLAELVIDAATDGMSSLLNKRFLDPACGSGIFLVAIFNRLAEEWRLKNRRARNKTRARALCEILENNLVGIDINETACRIACFSLYLALLDQLEPRDIQELAAKGTLLPRLLNLQSAGTRSKNKARTIICRDFFVSNLPIDNNFDVVVGNPPWVSRRNVAGDPSPVRWCRDRNLPVPQRQLAYPFLWKAPQHAVKHGRISLLVPSNVLVGKTDEFQREWLTRYAMERVVQLADLRFLLFTNAIRPAAIVCYRAHPPDTDHILHETAIADFSELRAAVVSVWPQDRKQISLTKILNAAERHSAGALWKTHLRATPRDQKFLERLMDLPRLEEITGTPAQRRRWVKGQGLQPLGPNDSPTGDPAKQAWWGPDQPFLKAQGGAFTFDLVLTPDECTEVNPDWSELRRLPDRRIFTAPLVVLSQGFSRVGYSDFDVVFQHSLQSISGPQPDSQLLKFLAAFLQSHLAQYFAFHTGAYWGIERDKVSLYEILRLPFPLPNDTPNPNAANAIVDEVSDILNALQVDLAIPMHHLDRATNMRDQLNDLVSQYFDIDAYERMLLNDTVKYVIPSSTPSRGESIPPTLRAPSKTERQRYVSTLCRVLNEWSRQSDYVVSGKTMLSSASDLAIVTISKGRQKSRYAEEDAQPALTAALERIQPHLSESRRGFHFLRNLKVFDGPCVHLVKSLTLRSWLASAALNDADEIAAAILSGGPHGS